MSQNGNNVAFILGNYKSGSTWLLKILSLHPWVRTLSETHIFHHLTVSPDITACTHKLFNEVPWSKGGMRRLFSHRLLKLSAPLAKKWRADLSFDAQERASCLFDLALFDQLQLKRALLRMQAKEDYCRFFFEFIAERLQPRKYLIEKSTDATKYAPFIHSIFPQAKLLVIYRDGRDVAISSRFFLENHLKNNSWSLQSSIIKWRQEVEAQLQYAKCHDIFTCSYEAMLENNEAVIRQAFQFMELPADEHIIKDVLHRSSFKFLTGRNEGEENRNRFIRKGVTGDWRNHFTAEDKKLFKDLAGDLLIKLGYEKDNNW